MTFYRIYLILIFSTLCSACVNFNHPNYIDPQVTKEPQDSKASPSLHIPEDTPATTSELLILEDREPITSVQTTPAAQPVTDPKDLSIWYYIRESDQITHANNRRIEVERNWFIKNQDYLNRVFKRAEPVMAYIAEEINKRGLPMELILLPVIESAYNPYAYSSAHAAGLWQFIPSTGKLYKLRQDWWYDGRRDIIASTNAALDYLKYLHERHGNDWLLALAAYNAGTGKVGRAVSRNRKYRRKADYWSIPLPKETKLYVPKFLALVDVVSNSHKYNVHLPHINLQPKVARVHLGDPIDLSLAAKFANTDPKTFYSLNPGFKRGSTGAGKHFELLIPYENKSSFESQLFSLPDSERIQWARHIIRKGDTLNKIAKQYKVSVSQIKKVNNLSSNVIRLGKTLKLPTGSSLQANAVIHNPWQAKFERQQASLRTHRVKRGDSLWSISKRYGVSVTNIARWNNMSRNGVLRIGQKLKIKPGRTSSSSRQNALRKVKYRVKPGDSLYRIARTFKVSIPEITKWNTLNNKDFLRPGQNLTLYLKR